MGDLRDRIRRDETPAERLLEFVPGFKGYRERETRRDADRMVRDYLVKLLQECHATLRSVTATFAKQAKLKHLGALDSLGKRLEKVTDLLRHADAGYSGWFAAAKIKEEHLDRLYEYDVSLKQFIGDLQTSFAGLESAEEDALPDAVKAAEAALQELEHMVRNREQVAMDLVP